MQPQAESELEQLNRRYRPALVSFFLRRVRDHAEAEDLTQDVFARLAGSAATGATGQVRNAHAYVFQIAANLLRDRGRREKVRGDYRASLDLSDEVFTDVLDPDRVLGGRQSLAQVVDALRDLPQRTRAIFILYRLENLRHREIADMFGISVSAVEKQVLKATVHLAGRLEADS